MLEEPMHSKHGIVAENFSEHTVILIETFSSFLLISCINMTEHQITGTNFRFHTD